MDIFYVERQKNFIKPLVVKLSNYTKTVFDDSFTKSIKGNPDEFNGAVEFYVESYKYFSHIFNKLMDEIDLDDYEGKIDNELFSIIRDLYFNLCLYVDNNIRMSEIVLQQTRPSLFMLLDKSSKVYDYQSDNTTENIQSLHKEMVYRFNELFPE